MRLAARGARDMDTGEQPVQDPDDVRQLRLQARRIHVEAVTAATLLTGVSLLAVAWRAG